MGLRPILRAAPRGGKYLIPAREPVRSFGWCYSPKTGLAYIGTAPSKKRVIRICETISEMTGRDQTLLDQELVVSKLNRTMIGWANYCCLGPVSEVASVVVCQAQTGVAGGQTVSGGISA